MGQKRGRNSNDEQLIDVLTHFNSLDDDILEALQQAKETDYCEYVEEFDEIYENLIDEIIEDVQVLEDPAEEELGEGEKNYSDFVGCLNVNFRGTYPKTPFPECLPEFPKLHPRRDEEIGYEVAWNHPFRKFLSRKLSFKHRRIQCVQGASPFDYSSNRKRRPKSSIPNASPMIITPRQISHLPPLPPAFHLPDDTPKIPNGNRLLPKPSFESRNLNHEALAQLPESDFEPNMLEFLAQNPLGRTILPLRFQLDHSPDEAEAVVDHLKEGHDKSCGENDSELTLSQLGPLTADSTSGAAMMVQEKHNEKLLSTPSRTTATRAGEETTIEQHLPPKSPGVKKLISFYNQQGTPAYRYPPFLRHAPPLPLSSQQRIRDRRSKGPDFSQEAASHQLETQEEKSDSKESRSNSRCMGQARRRSSSSSLVVGTVPMVMLENISTREQRNPSNERWVSTENENDGVGVTVGFDFNPERACKQELEEVISPDSGTDRQDHTNNIHDDDMERIIPDDGDDDDGDDDDDDDGDENDDDVPIPMISDHQENDDVQMSSLVERRMDTDAPYQRDEHPGDTQGMRGIGEEEKEEKNSLGVRISEIPRELVNRKFVSVGPSSTVTDEEGDIHMMHELGIKSRQAPPKDLEILIYPGQQKRKKAKDIDWEVGTVRPVQFRGAESRTTKHGDVKQRRDNEPIFRQQTVDAEEMVQEKGNGDAVEDDDAADAIDEDHDQREVHPPVNLFGLSVDPDSQLNRDDGVMDDRKDVRLEWTHPERIVERDDDYDKTEEEEEEEEGKEVEEEDGILSRQLSSELTVLKKTDNGSHPEQNIVNNNKENHLAFILSNLQLCGPSAVAAKEDNEIDGALAVDPPSRKLQMARERSSVPVNCDGEFVDAVNLATAPTAVEGEEISAGISPLVPALPSASVNSSFLCNSNGLKIGNSAIPRPFPSHVLKMSALQIPVLNNPSFSIESRDQTVSVEANTIGQSLTRLTPRPLPEKKRMHRFLKKIGDKNWQDQADLSEDDIDAGGRLVKGKTRCASWVKNTPLWHQKVKEQSRMDPISIFGCGVRPVEFKDVFKTPDFHRAYRELSKYQNHRHQSQLEAKELITKEGREEKVKKWTQDKRQCGFGDHDGVTLHEVLRFQKRVGRNEDVSYLVWDDWVLCNNECEHNSKTRQPWFQQLGTSPSGPYPKDTPSPGANSTAVRRHIWGSPLPQARWLEHVEEEDVEEEKGTMIRQSPLNYPSGLFFCTINKSTAPSMDKPKAPVAVPPLNLLGHSTGPTAEARLTDHRDDRRGTTTTEPHRYQPSRVPSSLVNQQQRGASSPSVFLRLNPSGTATQPVIANTAGTVSLATTAAFNPTTSYAPPASQSRQLFRPDPSTTGSLLTRRQNQAQQPMVDVMPPRPPFLPSSFASSSFSTSLAARPVHHPTHSTLFLNGTKP